MRTLRLMALAMLPLAGGAAAARAQEWTGSGVTVRVSAGRLTISSGTRTLVRGASLRFGLLDPGAVAVRSSTPAGLTLELTYASSATAAAGQATNPNGPGADRPLTATVEITPVQGGIRLHGSAPWARQLAIDMDDLGDHFFGLVEWLYPDNRTSPDLRGQVVPLDVEGQASRLMENYADVASAFYLSSRGYGSFFDTFARGRYTFGVAGRTQIYHETGTLDWYVFPGADGAAIHEAYYRVIGGPKHVPMWALGPVVWRDENRGGAPEVLDDVAHFRDLRIPITALWIDRPYSNGTNGWSAMDFNAKFADPATWVRTLREREGVELMTWIAPMVFSAGDSFPGLFRTYVGYFDLSNAAAVAEFERRVRAGQYAFGVKGHKMDRADEYFPLYQRWADSTPAEAQRHRYLYLYARATHDMLTHAWGADEFNFARGTFHRAQPFLSAVWGGDSRSSWSGMADNLANGVRVGFMGFPVWGSDVGGYLGEGRISEELYARWLELGSWSGLFEVKLDGAGGSGEDRPPWKYSPALQGIFRAASERRMRLLPTLYSLANTSARTGVLMQPLAYAFPGDSATWGIADEFILGGIFLVAPVLRPGTERAVYLPRGRWYDLSEPTRILDGGRRLRVAAPLDRTPVFVRAGSVFLTGDVFPGSRRGWSAPSTSTPGITIQAYPSTTGSTTFLYVDDGDADRVKAIVLAGDPARLTLTAPALSRAGAVEAHLPRPPRSVTLSGAQAPHGWDAATGVLRVPFGPGTPLELIVEY